jgi:ABC-type dipeptide/oligopeptide/nickel transport system permease component
MVAIAGQSMPVFWVGVLLILCFTVYLGWLPSARGMNRLGLQGKKLARAGISPIIG